MSSRKWRQTFLGLDAGTIAQTILLSSTSWFLAVGCVSGLATSGADTSIVGQEDGSPSVVGEAGQDASSVDRMTFTPRSSADRIAQRLAQLIWNTDTPDQAMLTGTAAAVTPDDYGQIAERMLTDPRAREGIEAFISRWLHLDDVYTKVKTNIVLSHDLRQGMHDEAPAFASHVFFDGDGRLETLLTANYTFMNETLAVHYGVSGISGPTMRQVPYDTPERVGIFGGAGVLTLAGDPNQPTWPMMRFWYVSESLFCRTSGTGPFVMTGFPVDPSKPMRQLTEEVTKGDTCMTSCHRYVNPIGFAFLKFDTVGRFRPTDVGGSIDSSGLVPTDPPSAMQLPAFPSELLGMSFANQADLMSKIANSNSVRRCIARQWLLYATKRTLFSGADATVDSGVEQVFQTFGQKNGDLRSVIPAIVRTPAFLTAADGSAMP